MGTVEFDLYAAIRKLAEAEWVCPLCGGLGVLTSSGGFGNSPPPEQYMCGDCGGCGRIVPFAALRVKCKPFIDNARRNSHIVWSGGDALYHPASECPGWIPEPDVEKVCWRITKQFEATELAVWVGRAGLAGKLPSTRFATKKEATIGAALVWLEEQHER